MERKQNISGVTFNLDDLGIVIGAARHFSTRVQEQGCCESCQKNSELTIEAADRLSAIIEEALIGWGHRN